MSQFLLQAAQAGNISFLQDLIQQGADINFQDENGNTALSVAAKHGYVDIIQHLVNAKANINHQNYNGETPLITASHYEKIEVISSLIELGANTEIEDLYGNTALLKAMDRLNQKAIDTMIAKNINVDNPNSYDKTPLLFAAETDNEESIACLINAGADINAQTKLGITPLMSAIINKNILSIQTLIKLKANINVKNIYGKTALDIAISLSFPTNIIELLTPPGNTIPISYSQNHLIKKLSIFLAKLTKEPTVSLEDIENSLCHKLSATWLFYKAIGAEKKSFFNVLKKLNQLEYNALLKQEKKIKHLFQNALWHQFLNKIIPSFDLYSLSHIHKSLKAKQICSLSFSFTFTELQNALKLLAKPNIMLHISSPHHSIGLLQKDNKFYLYDPNVTKEEMSFDAIDDLLTYCVITSSGLLQETFYPLSINSMEHPNLTFANIDYPLEEVLLTNLIEQRKSTFSPNELHLDDLNEDTNSLHMATLYNQPKSINTLIKYGAKVNVTNSEKMTPLHIAAKMGSIEAIHVLLKAKANPLTKDTNEDIPLFLAIIAEQIEAVAILAKNKKALEQQNNEGMSPLHFAAQIGNIDIINTLLENNPNQLSIDPNGSTPLLIAVKTQNIEIIKVLAKHKKALEIQDNKFVSPLMFAAWLNDVNIMTILLQNGALINAKSPTRDTALMYAAAQSNIGAITLLLNNKADPAIKNADGFSSLAIAVQKDQKDSIIALIKGGSDPNGLSATKTTPIMEAITSENPHLLQILIEHGADPNAIGLNGSALHMAILYNQPASVSYLLQQGADINIVDDKLNTPLLFAAETGSIPILSELINAKANIKAKNANGYTALHMAINDQTNNIAIMKILQENNLDPTIKDNNGFAPLDLAKKTNNNEIITYIEKWNTRHQLK